MKASDAERQVVLAEGVKRGWPSAELDSVIAIESGWDPSAHHPVTKAGGLIGFMPFVLPKVGYLGTPESFWLLTAAQQAPYVGHFFDLIGVKWKLPGDTYLAVAAPKYVGAPDSQIVYARGTKAWELNPGWRDPRTGEITAGSIRAVLFRKMAKRAPPGSPPAPARSQGERSSSSGDGLGLMVALWVLKELTS